MQKIYLVTADFDDTVNGLENEARFRTHVKYWARNVRIVEINERACSHSSYMGTPYCGEMSCHNYISKHSKMTQYICTGCHQPVFPIPDAPEDMPAWVDGEDFVVCYPLAPGHYHKGVPVNPTYEQAYQTYLDLQENETEGCSQENPCKVCLAFFNWQMLYDLGFRSLTPCTPSWRHGDIEDILHELWLEAMDYHHENDTPDCGEPCSRLEAFKSLGF